MFEKIVSALMTLFLAVLVGLNVQTFVMQHTSPYILDDIHIVSDRVIREGGDINIHYDLTKLRVCRLDINRFIKDDATGHIVWRDTIPGVSSLPGHLNLDVPFKLPAEVKADGDYALSIELVSECTEGIHVDPWKTLRFHVEK